VARTEQVRVDIVIASVVASAVAPAALALAALGLDEVVLRLELLLGTFDLVEHRSGLLFSWVRWACSN
jgi:hypothetical protein